MDRCAVQRFIKSPKCYACGAATGGHFAKAEKILAKMEEKNRRKREEKGLEMDGGGIEFGGGASGDEDGDGEGEDGGEGEIEDGGGDEEEEE
jgi:RING finger protein 113A